MPAFICQDIWRQIHLGLRFPADGLGVHADLFRRDLTAVSTSPGESRQKPPRTVNTISAVGKLLLEIPFCRKFRFSL